MTNHPNRNWRRRMQSEAATFLDAQPWPDGDGAFILSRDELRAFMERAYCGGYASGRMSRAAGVTKLGSTS